MPIKPSEILDKKHAAFPPQVLEAFNELIARNFNTGKARVWQKEIAALIASKLHTSVSEVYDRCLLDVEDIYKEAGWIVEYHKPAYNELGDAYFVFMAYDSI